jgi:branched-subunit amino acid ABC-type transport system permease component
MFFQFLLLGIGAGAVYAAFALGLVLTYRASGVVNFAHGAMAMVPVYLFYGMREEGKLLLPLPGGAGTISLSGPTGTIVALVASLVLAAAIGALAYFVVFRPLRRSPPLARVVASVALAVTLQGVGVLRYGVSSVAVPAILPQHTVKLFGATVPEDRLYLFGLVAVVTLILWATFRYTAFGLSSRAVAEDENVAAINGISPDRVAVLNWMLASVLAALAGIVVGPITALDPTNFTLLVIPALGAALIGRLVSFWITAVAAMAIGMLQSGLLDFQEIIPNLQTTALRSALPFLAILVAIAIQGNRLPTRGVIVTTLLPRSPEPRLRASGIVLALATAVGLLGVFTLQGGFANSLILSLIGGLIALSVVVVTGFVGQISLAQMAFAGIAGFFLSKFAHNLGIPFPLAPLLAAGATAVVGVAVGVPALRVRGVNLAIVTLAFAVAVDDILFKNLAWTGGVEGSIVPTTSIFGIDIGAGSDKGFGVLCLVVLVLCSAGVVLLRRSDLGHRMLAVRANERAAAACGVDVERVKLQAFAISAFLAGLGGCLLGYHDQTVSYQTFAAVTSLSLVVSVYLAGIASITGGVIAGFLLQGSLFAFALDDWFSLGQYQTLITGLAALVMVLTNPGGLTDQTALYVNAIGRRLRRRPVAVSPLAAKGA